jgi:hypothetical protein
LNIISFKESKHEISLKIFKLLLRCLFSLFAVISNSILFGVQKNSHPHVTNCQQKFKSRSVAPTSMNFKLQIVKQKNLTKTDYFKGTNVLDFRRLSVASHPPCLQLRRTAVPNSPSFQLIKLKKNSMSPLWVCCIMEGSPFLVEFLHKYQWLAIISFRFHQTALPLPRLL